MTNLGTVDHCKAMYALFCKLPPFDKIEMPKPSEIKWIVSEDRDEILGEYIPEPHTITVSLARQAHFENICKTILHEMVHMYLYLSGKSNYDRHDKTFKKWTAKIASVYGFDPKEL
jgi:hypothetical protein